MEREGVSQFETALRSAPTSGEHHGLFVLHGTCPSEEHLIDIVAVHGLKGHWKRTWTASNGQFWLADFVPAQFPTARVLSYGWNSSVVGKAVTNLRDEAEMLLWYLKDNKNRVDYANRPLLFVCHSLGGLLVKKAMVIAHERGGEDEVLLNRTKAVLLFAVPHGGSPLAKTACYAARFASWIGIQTNPNYVKLLREDSDSLAELTCQFMQRAKNIDTITFFETTKTSIFKASSTTGLVGRDVVGIPDSNHRTICTFDSATSKRYLLVSEALSRLIEKHVRRTPTTLGKRQEHRHGSASFGESAEAPEGPSRATSYNPVRYSSPYFIGREDYLHQLEGFFQPRAEAEAPRRREFVLHGIGGAGKTQICLRFAELYSNLFWKVFWIDATNKTTVQLSYQTIVANNKAELDGVDESPDSVVQWLSNVPGEWLLILDNFDDDDGFLEPYIPTGRRGNLLITTRNPNIRNRSGSGAFSEVCEMPLHEAKILLRTTSLINCPMASNLSAEVDSRLESIAGHLHSLPLALDHAGAAISSGLCHPDDYLKMLENHRRHLLGNPNFRGASGYNHTLYSTWSLTTTLLENRCRQPAPGPSADQTALELFNMLAFLHNNEISEEIFQRAAESINGKFDLSHKAGSELSSGSKHLPMFMLGLDKNGEWDCLYFRQAIQQLRAFSLVRMGVGQATYSIHPLVHHWSRERLSSSELNTASLRVQAILAQAAWTVEKSGDMRFARMLLAHITSFHGAVAESGLDVPFFDDSTDAFSWIFSKNGLWEDAARCARQMYTHRAQLLGESNDLTLRAGSMFAVALRCGGGEKALSQARDIQENICRITTRSLGDSHITTMRRNFELGGIYHLNGEFVKAEKLLEVVYQSSLSALGETHQLTLDALLQLSSVLRERGRYKKAETIQRMILQIKLKLFGDADLRTAGAMASLASTLTSRGNVEESEALKLQITEIRLQVLGPSHPDTLMAYAHLAVTYVQQEKWEKAEDVILGVISQREKMSNGLNREVLRARLILANVYEGQSRLPEAETQYQIVLKGRKVVLGEDHANTLWSMHKLAAVWEKIGKTSEAIDLWKKTLNYQKQNGSLGEGHWETQVVMKHLDSALNPPSQGRTPKKK